MKSTGAPAEQYTGGTGEDERRAGHDEGDGGVETQSLDNSLVFVSLVPSINRNKRSGTYREEGVEAASTQMEILHQAEQPRPLIPHSLLQAIHSRSLLIIRVGQLILLHAGVSELALTVVEPARRQGRIGEEPETEEGDEARGGALDDEEPAPACDAVEAVHAGEDAGCDEGGEARCEDLGAVEEGDAGGDLCGVC